MSSVCGYSKLITVERMNEQSKLIWKKQGHKARIYVRIEEKKQCSRSLEDHMKNSHDLSKDSEILRFAAL